MVNTDQSAACHGEVISQQDNTITARFHSIMPITSATACQLQVVVGNVLYCWQEAQIEPVSQATDQFVITLKSRPKINNRRKYPRLDLANPCLIHIADDTRTITGSLDNLSASGFAFLTHDAFFADHKGTNITLEIQNFDLVQHNRLEGRVIRCSNNDGLYIVGCQMPEDDTIIRDYVERKLKG